MNDPGDDRIQRVSRGDRADRGARWKPLDAPRVCEILDALTGQGVLIRTPAGDRDAFGLARRDRSATPDTRARRPGRPPAASTVG